MTHHFHLDQFIEAYDVFDRAADTGALKGRPYPPRMSSDAILTRLNPRPGRIADRAAAQHAR